MKVPQEVSLEKKSEKFKQFWGKYFRCATQNHSVNNNTINIMNQRELAKKYYFV